jgi:1-acyl-sn-glycerol-3-phosphate acyltransferase
MKRSLAKGVLRLLGWRLEGARPQFDRYVLIAAPHTSNWDFPLMLLFATAFGIKITWMGKHSLFRFPMGGIMRSMGGLPIVRHEKSNLVDSMVEAFSERAHLVLTVPTEGTRARVEYWKSGFYHIARRASVPIVPSFLDFGRKLGGFGPALELSGDIAQDMQYFRDFYAGMKGKFPEKFGPIRLREEDNEQA